MNKESLKIVEDDVLVRIFTSEREKLHGIPVYEAIVLKAKEMGLEPGNGDCPAFPDRRAARTIRTRRAQYQHPAHIHYHFEPGCIRAGFGDGNSPIGARFVCKIRVDQ